VFNLDTLLHEAVPGLMIELIGSPKGGVHVGMKLIHQWKKSQSIDSGMKLHAR
jgi:hypothetical protein